MIDHFDLFGLRQVLLNWKQRARPDHPFRTPGLYKVVRHPLYLGWLTVLWATPTLTAGRALFGVVCSAYILGAIVLEERDLVDRFGARYQKYQGTTPSLIPRFGRRNKKVELAG